MTNSVDSDQLASSEANWSVDSDQLASSEANWSGSTLFAKIGHVMLSKRRVKQNVLNNIFSYFCTKKHALDIQ